MATTTGGTTYVTSTDLVANYPTASLALANRVDVVASGGPGLVKTAGYTITVADILAGNKFLYNSASPGTFTLPTLSLVDGMTVNVAQIGAGVLTVSGGTIVGTTVTNAQYQGLRFVYVASGTTWYSIAPNATAPGLAIVTPTSIANSGGSASATGGAVTFSAVTSVSLNGVFSSTYDNYRVMFYGSSSAGNLNFRYRAAGTDTSTNYQRVGFFADSGPGSGTFLVGTGQSEIVYSDKTNWAVAAEHFRPNLAANTYSSATTSQNTSIPAVILLAAQQTATTQFDGFTLISSSGNITGTVRVYGYKNS